VEILRSNIVKEIGHKRDVGQAVELPYKDIDGTTRSCAGSTCLIVKNATFDVAFFFF
jgi:hypothetical protein